MITYKDKTWCNFSECKNSKDCKSFLTDKVKQDADKWWCTYKNYTPTPIMKYTTKPDCYEKDS